MIRHQNHVGSFTSSQDIAKNVICPRSGSFRKFRGRGNENNCCEFINERMGIYDLPKHSVTLWEVFKICIKFFLSSYWRTDLISCGKVSVAESVFLSVRHFHAEYFQNRFILSQNYFCNTYLVLTWCYLTNMKFLLCILDPQWRKNDIGYF